MKCLRVGRSLRAATAGSFVGATLVVARHTGRYKTGPYVTAEGASHIRIRKTEYRPYSTVTLLARFRG